MPGPCAYIVILFNSFKPNEVVISILILQMWKRIHFHQESLTSFGVQTVLLAFAPQAYNIIATSTWANKH